jgi:hypothetical protein
MSIPIGLVLGLRDADDLELLLTEPMVCPMGSSAPNRSRPLSAQHGDTEREASRASEAFA